MSNPRWRKVELRKQYVSPMGIKEEKQTIDREELQEEQRELIRQKIAEAEAAMEGMSSVQRREQQAKIAGAPDPDTWELENFEAYVLEEAQKYARMPVIEEVGDRLVHIYGSGQVLRVSVDVLEVMEEEPAPALELA